MKAPRDRKALEAAFRDRARRLMAALAEADTALVGAKAAFARAALACRQGRADADAQLQVALAQVEVARRVLLPLADVAQDDAGNAQWREVAE